MRFRFHRPKMRMQIIAFLLSTTPMIAVSVEKKIQMRVSAFHFPPVLTMRGEGENITIQGFGYDGINLLAEILGIQFTYVMLKKSEQEKYGLVRAIIRQLENKEVDIAPYTFASNWERYQIFDITHPVIFQDYFLLFAEPGEESPLLIVTKPFRYEVWMSIVAAATCSLAFVLVARQLDRKLHPNRPDEGQGPNRTDTTQMAIKNDPRPIKNRFALKIFSLGTWGLMMTILTNAYTTNLISFLTIPSLKPVPNTIAELAKEPHRKLTIEKEYVLAQNILNAQSGPMKILGDMLRQNEELLTKTSHEAVANILEKDYAYVSTRAYIFYVVGNDLKATGKCRYAISKPLPMNRGFGFGLQKNGPFNAIIERKLLHITESRIIIDYIYDKYTTDIGRCAKREKKSTKKLAKLDLKDLCGAFLILSVGIVVSFLAFLIEHIMALRAKRNIASPQSPIP